MTDGTVGTIGSPLLRLHHLGLGLFGRISGDPGYPHWRIVSWLDAQQHVVTVEACLWAGCLDDSVLPGLQHVVGEDLKSVPEVGNGMSRQWLNPAPVLIALFICPSCRIISWDL